MAPADDNMTLPTSRPRSRRSMGSASRNEALEKENMTTDVSALSSIKRPPQQGDKNKKSRSKSLGPGGLDALNAGTGNRRQSTANPPIKSILKISVPLSPPKAIPSFDATRKRSPGKESFDGTPGKRQKHAEGILIDFLSSSADAAQTIAPVTVNESLPNPLDASGPNKITEESEEQQLVAARERQEREKKARDRQAAIAARRKSLANRRVSFAPEATLHTWNLEIGEESTTSSASTNSTRRASSLAAPSPHPPAHLPATGSDASEPPSTPPEQVEEPTVKASPAHQRDLHQKKRRRRSSGIPPMNFNNPDDEDFSSSPYSGSSFAGSDDTGHTIGAGADDSSDSDNDTIDEEEATGMSIDGRDGTGESTQSADSTSSSARLDEALRLAASQAGTRGIEFDEHGDESMEMADEEITASFQPWVKKGVYAPQAVRSLSQENQNPFSPAFGASVASMAEPTQGQGEDDELSMDVTKAVGGILRQQQQDTQDLSMDMTKAVGGILQSHQSPKASPKRGRRKSFATARRSSAGRLAAAGDGLDSADATMEFTTAVGGIQQDKPLQQRDHDPDESAIDEDEEMTMEFTGVVGGMVNPLPMGKAPQNLDGNANLSRLDTSFDGTGSFISDDTMDMTVAGGGILAPIEERTEPQDGDTVAMDVTTAMGNILPPDLTTDVKSRAKKLMELETDAGQLASSPFQEKTSPISPLRRGAKSVTPKHLASGTSETGSPSLAGVRGRSTRKSFESRLSSTPRISSTQGTPVKGPATPSKQMTPLPAKPTTPGKTPPMHNVTFRSASPKKLFKEKIKRAAITPKSVTHNISTPQKLFQKNEVTGIATPSIVLKPGRRRSSGLGIDKEGLGSPRVEALFDRRGSLGEDARAFVPEVQAVRGVRFDNPRLLEQELDQEREEEERRESGRSILEQEADLQEEENKDMTANLKDMIQSMTPKKERKKLNGRKSLAVGAAKGILGKRPAELDEDDDDGEEDGTPKRLKGREGSPVKKVKLPTSSRAMGAIGNFVLAETSNRIIPTTTNSLAKSTITTPRHQGRFKDAEREPSASKLSSFDEKIEKDAEDLDMAEATLEQPDDRLHLQDFLNMTNIHFMDLSTTKRRHTLAPASAKKPRGSQDGAWTGGTSVEDCVVAALCTLPMLELYQHSCRELKSYISEGRRLIRSIESSTYEEQPPLFQEYLSAPPDVRIIMDNQFRNVKTHARLSSKSMWYDWRMKLLEGLQEGLDNNIEGMDNDEATLEHEEVSLAPLENDLLDKEEALLEELRILTLREEEWKQDDQAELSEARTSLEEIEDSLDSKKQYLLQLEEDLKQSESRIQIANELKAEFDAQIKEAERAREEHKGWSVNEVNEAKASANELEKATGWTVSATASEENEPYGPSLTMTYASTLCLFFHPSAFLSPASKPTRRSSSLSNNAPISLTFAPVLNRRDPSPFTLTTLRRFFLQLLQLHIHSLPQAATNPKQLLDFISSGWTLATTVAEEERSLHLLGITETEILGDEVLGVRCRVITPGGGSRVDVGFKLQAVVRNECLTIETKSHAGLVHGDVKGADTMSGKLQREMRGCELGSGIWAMAVRSVVLSEGTAPIKSVAPNAAKETKPNTPARSKAAATPKTAPLTTVTNPTAVAKSATKQAPTVPRSPAMTKTPEKAATSSKSKNLPLPPSQVRPRTPLRGNTTSPMKERDVNVHASVALTPNANEKTGQPFGNPSPRRRGGALPRTPPEAMQW